MRVCVISVGPEMHAMSQICVSVKTETTVKWLTLWLVPMTIQRQDTLVVAPKVTLARIAVSDLVMFRASFTLVTLPIRMLTVVTELVDTVFAVVLPIVRELIVVFGDQRVTLLPLIVTRKIQNERKNRNTKLCEVFE